MIRLFASIWLAAVAGGGSCRSDQAPSTLRASDCGPKLPCPTGLDCREGACVGSEGAEEAIHLRIRPAADRSLAAVELVGLSVPEPVFTLAEPVQVPFQVALDGQVLDPEGRSVAATRVVALPQGGLGAASLGVEGQQSAVNPAIFSLAIAPWWPTATGMRSLTAYRLRMALPGLPPWEADLRWNQVEPRVVVEIPRTDSVVRLPGTVRVGGGNPLPLAQVRVVAFGEDGSAGPLSSEGFTDALGRFELRFWPAGSVRRVRLQATSTDPQRPLPTLVQGVDVPLVGQAPPVVLEVGDSQRLFTATIQAVAEGRPLAGADVQLAVEVGASTFTSRGRTDDQGRVRLPAWPGTHRIDVVASLDDPVRVTRVARDLSASAPEATVAPLPRTPVAGQVLDPEGVPVAQALVEARLLRATFGDPTLVRPEDVAPQRAFQTETLDDGSFLLSLDPGTHALTITPGRGLPIYHTEIAFSGDQPRTLDPITLVPAAVVLARLVDEDGAPVADTLVEAWSGGARPVRVWVDRTGSDGRFRLRVPTRPEPLP